MSAPYTLLERQCVSVYQYLILRRDSAFVFVFVFIVGRMIQRESDGACTVYCSGRIGRIDDAVMISCFSCRFGPIKKRLAILSLLSSLFDY